MTNTTTNHSMNEQPGRTNPQTKENTMNTRTLIKTSLVLAFGLGCFLAPARALAVFGQDKHGDNLTDPKPLIVPPRTRSPVPPSRPEIRAVYTAEMIFTKEHAWYRNWSRIVQDWHYWQRQLKAHNTLLWRYRFGSPQQKPIRALIRRDEAQLRRLAMVGSPQVKQGIGLPNSFFEEVRPMRLNKISLG